MNKIEVSTTIPMSIDDALLLIKKSIGLEKYENARNVLEDVIKSHKKYIIEDVVM